MSAAKTFDFDSFDIGENTLLEIEKRINVSANRSTSRIQQKRSIESNLESEDEIVEESPNAKEKVSSFFNVSLHDRLKNANRRAWKNEKSKRNRPVFVTPKRSQAAEMSSISKYLQDAGEIDFSAWERSAAKLLSPGIFNESLQTSKAAEANSQDLFSDDPLDTAISGHHSIETSFNIDSVEDSFFDLDNITFMETVGKENSVASDKLINDEMRDQKLQMEASQTARLEPIIKQLNLSVQPKQHNDSLRVNISKDLRYLSNWNLPQSVVNEYRKKNVIEMFDWQCECLKNPKVLFERSNLVYSAPTSAGKTLVSEIIMIKNIVELNKKALFILPFVSVVREKTFYLQDLMASSGMRVEGFFGGYHPPGGFDKIDLAVCTIEKANSIVNRLLEQDKLSEIGVIVFDEIHLISDPSRGYILELLLTKILYMCEKFNHKIQIVTMSATLPNVELLRKWLRAEFFHTDFRPIELREMIKIGKNIYDEKMNLIRVVEEKVKDYFPQDTDEVCEIAMETILDNCQLIIFCPSKEWCESLCHNIAKGIYNMLSKKLPEIEKILDKQRIENLLAQIKGLPTGVDQKLQLALNYGCAFHHAGLTTDERDVVEMGYKAGTLKVIVATSTLASGVNLPARRVIIRTPMFGRKMMSNLTYRQMIGRAGRKGKDVLGESILVCSNETAKVGKQLVEAPLDPISSCLDSNNHAHLKRALLEIIASGVAKTKSDLENFVNSTLYCQQNNINFFYFQAGDEDLKAILANTSKKKSKEIDECEGTDKDNDPLKSAIDFLLDYDFIRLHVDGDSNEIQFVPTRLGLACLSSSMPPREGFFLFSELQKSQQNFVLESELHSIYLVTSLSVANELQNIDWHYYAEMYEELPLAMKRVGTIVGVSDSFLIKAIRGKLGSDLKTLEIHKRFYTALALQELVNEKSIAEVSIKYKIHRGLLQKLQQMTAVLAGTVTTFCKSLQYNLLALILSQFQERLFFGIHPDLIDLMKLPSMTSTRIARALHKKGFETLGDLAKSKTLDVENVLMSLATNFMIVGKSKEMNFQDVAKLLINDARNHLQNEIGFKQVEWNQESKRSEQMEIEETSMINHQCLLSMKDSVVNHKPMEVILNKTNKRNRELTADDENIHGNSKKIKSGTIYRNNLRSSANVNLSNCEKLFGIKREATIEPKDEKTSLSILKDQSNKPPQLPKITNVLTDEEAFNLFIKKVSTQNSISMSLVSHKVQLQTQMIGGSLLQETESKYNFTYGDSYINCISFCHSSDCICNLNLQSAKPSMIPQVKQFLTSLMSRTDLTLNVYNAREHIKKLLLSLGLKETSVQIHDPKILSWLVNPDADVKWQQMVDKYIPDHSEILKLAARPAADTIKTAVECFLCNKLTQKQREGIENSDQAYLLRNCFSMEMPIQKVLLKMEIAGFPVNEQKLRDKIEVSVELQRQLELYIYSLNGSKFNLTSNEEVSKAVGMGRSQEKKTISTNKKVLEKLDNPIAKHIMTWRTLNKTIANLLPLTKIMKASRVYANSFSLTQTGRISMYDPNLQNVTKDFVVELKDSKEPVSFRSVFECRKGKVFLSADFCQLELRILTHRCKDPGLTKIMKVESEDIFKKMAAKWNKIEETEVTSIQRNQTKQLCYGIIYGMGKKALADSMKVDEETSSKITAEFHAAYPQILIYKNEIIEKAREQGYVETIAGRRRYLPMIKSENSRERSQAERQAFNTCIQGSASDLTKNAMLQMDRNLKQQDLDGFCDLVLHLHDELIFEVSIEKLKAVVEILKQSMQNCYKLSVPLLVKIKTGQSWGQMKDCEN